MSKSAPEMKSPIPVVDIDAEGRVLIPKEVLAALKIKPGTSLTVRAKHGCIILRAGDTAVVRSLQGTLEGLSLVDALENARRLESSENL